MVIDGIVCSLDSSKLQAVRLYEPLVADFCITAIEAVVIVYVLAGLGIYVQLAKPVLAVECGHLVLRSFRSIIL